jgi:ribonuclease HI
MLKQIRPDTEMLSCRPSDNNDVKNATFRKLVNREYRYYQGQADESMYPKSNPILTEIQDELAEIGEMKTVKFVWRPGHAGISGNEKADEGTNEVLRQCLPPQSMVVAAVMITRAKFNAKKL